MKLWVLKPIDTESRESLWNPWYDKAFGMIVRAESEQEAREIAGQHAGDEKPSAWENKSCKNPWLEAAHTTCLELTADGEVGLVLRDFASA